MLTLNKQAGAWILVLLLSLISHARSDEEAPTLNLSTEKITPDTSSDSASSIPSASPLGGSYVSPKVDPKRIKVNEICIGNLARDRQEGWVLVNMMVDKQGRPYETSAADSSNSKLEKCALFRAKGLRFNPALLNGIPVDAAISMRFSFRSSFSNGASAEFKRNFKALEDALEKDQRSVADEALQKLKVTKLSEDAYYHLARYLYARQWGTQEDQLNELGQAIPYERIPSNLSAQDRSVLGELFRLQIKTGRFGAALDTYDLFEEHMKQNPAVVESVAAIKELSKSDEIFSVRGESLKVTLGATVYSSALLVFCSPGVISPISNYAATQITC